MVEQTQHRPFGVTLIGILIAIHGAFALAVSVYGFFTGFYGFFGASIEGLFGVVLLYVAAGMWTLQPWAWMLTLVLEVMQAIFAVLTAIVVPGAEVYWVIAALAVVIIVYLNSSGVRRAFGIPSPTG